MRSSLLILAAFGALVTITSVDAIFRPVGYKHHPPPSPYNGGGSGDDSCEEHTKKPKTSTTAVLVETTTTKQPTPTCPDGFIAFRRTASALNAETSIWCMTAVFQKDPIKVNDAPALCASQATGAVLTALGSDQERQFFTAQLLAAVQSYGYSSGAIAVDGRRNAECVSRDRAVLDSLPCSNKSLSFHLVDTHTDPAYMWAHWAVDEPTANAWTYDIEECTQLAVIPQNANRTNLLNDIYCNMNVAPNDPENTLYWNFGALCGVLPTYE